MVGPSGSFQSFSDINRSPEVITSTIQQDMHKSKNIYIQKVQFRASFVKSTNFIYAFRIFMTCFKKHLLDL